MAVCADEEHLDTTTDPHCVVFRARMTWGLVTVAMRITSSNTCKTLCWALPHCKHWKRVEDDQTYNPGSQTGNSKLLAPLVYHHYFTGTSQNCFYPYRKVVNVLPSYTAVPLPPLVTLHWQCSLRHKWWTLQGVCPGFPSPKQFHVLLALVFRWFVWDANLGMKLPLYQLF